MFLVNSRQPRFAATPSSSTSESLHPTGHSLSRSYGVILQSSLTRVLSSALGYSPCLPVSVYSTVTTITRYEVFLGSMGSTSLWSKAPPHHLSVFAIRKADLPTFPTYRLKPGQPTPGWPTLPRHPFAQTPLWWYRNINLFSIAYAFRPRLRH